MIGCDLCRDGAVARFVALRARAEDRVWLCRDCFRRYEDHDLEPGELLALVRRTAGRRGRCESCTERAPVTEVRLPAADGGALAFRLCEACAREASERGASILSGQAAIAGDTTVDERYERALEIARRRRRIRRVK